MIKGEDHWRNLWWIMAKGDIAQYESLKRKEIVEFFSLMKKFNADIERQNAKHREK